MATVRPQAIDLLVRVATVLFPPGSKIFVANHETRDFVANYHSAAGDFITFKDDQSDVPFRKMCC